MGSRGIPVSGVVAWQLHNAKDMPSLGNTHRLNILLGKV